MEGKYFSQNGFVKWDVTPFWPLAHYFFFSFCLVMWIVPFLLVGTGSNQYCLQRAWSFSDCFRSRDQGYITLTNFCVLNTWCLGLAQLFFLGKMVSVMLLAFTTWACSLLCCHCLIRRNDKSSWNKINLVINQAYQEDQTDILPFISSRQGSIFALWELVLWKDDSIEHFNYKSSTLSSSSLLWLP